jgi:hypothetical protein
MRGGTAPPRAPSLPLVLYLSIWLAEKKVVDSGGY